MPERNCIAVAAVLHMSRVDFNILLYVIPVYCSTGPTAVTTRSPPEGVIRPSRMAAVHIDEGAGCSEAPFVWANSEA